MRKILVLFVALACVLSLAACGTMGGYTHTDAEKIEKLPLPSVCEDRAIRNLMTALSANAKSNMLGDVNKDGDVTNADVLLLYQYIFNSNTYPLDDGSFALGDVNKDGKITNSDILSIYRYIFNKDLYPLEKQPEESTKDFMGPGIWM